MNPSDKQWYVFTFGVGQKYGGRYVRFYGTYEEAREKMVRYFGLTWAFQYSEKEWEAAVKRLTDKGRAMWIEKELTKSEYASKEGLHVSRPAFNPDEPFDETVADMLAVLKTALKPDPCAECIASGGDYMYDDDGEIVENCYDCPVGGKHE